ncbi:MAG TPA: alpha/beta hydrolase domain-containing protein [Actinomycetaceae bacterium]|nr:alpha/beta hydrolase domain-containing protein [Actinomycetaceae bacterium]
MTSTRTQMPVATGPLPVTADSYPFNTTQRSIVPLDLGALGYAEEEYFVSGDAAIYADDLTAGSEIPYTNRVVVRRPLDAARFSGVVILEILNASNGYPAEGIWRRAWDFIPQQGHAYVGFTSKPIDIAALKTFNPERYAPLSWATDPQSPQGPVPEDANPLTVVVPGAEEGLLWDIITQMGRLLRAPAAGGLLGGAEPKVILLIGQSQSAIMLNTWIRHFHGLVKADDGASLFDAYLNSVGVAVERPLRQQEAAEGFQTTMPDSPLEVDIPMITVTCEGDINLYGSFGHTNLARRGLADGPFQRHWCVVGAPHSELFTPAMPAAPEVLKAGRKPRRMTPETVATGNTFPLQATVTAAIDALLAWLVDGVPAAPSRFFDTDDDGALLRDDDGNVRGGLRYGIIEHAIARYDGAPTGGTLGTQVPLSREVVLERYPMPDDFLDAVAAVDDQLLAQGYLNSHGRRQLWYAATEMYSRAVS